VFGHKKKEKGWRQKLKKRPKKAVWDNFGDTQGGGPGVDGEKKVLASTRKRHLVQHGGVEFAKKKGERRQGPAEQFQRSRNKTKPREDLNGERRRIRLKGGGPGWPVHVKGN